MNKPDLDTEGQLRQCYLCNTEAPVEDLWKRPYGPEERVNVYLCEPCSGGNRNV